MSALRLVIISCLVILIHVIINTWFAPLERSDMIGKNNEKHLQRLDELIEKESDGKILYFSDSVDFYSSPNDKNKQSISSFIENKLTPKNFLSIANKAYHSGVYSSFVSYLCSKGEKSVDLIIVPINMRSFSTYWIENPLWQFNDLRRYLSSSNTFTKYYYHPAKAFKFYENTGLSRKDYENLDIYFEGQKGGKLKQYFGDEFNTLTNENIKKKIQLYYGESINKNNKRLMDLVHIADLAKRFQISILFYITPLDIDICETKGGEMIGKRIRENVQFIVDTLADQNAVVENWAFVFPTNFFYYGEPYPNEHLNQGGRHLLAENISGYVEHLFENNQTISENLANQNQ